MKPVQYIILNKGLGMSTGKASAQTAHASLGAYENFNTVDNAEIVEAWWNSGHTKIVLEARDTEHLLMVERYLNERGIKTHLIIDEGRTEIAPHTPTALASVIVDKTDENVQMAFGDLKTYKDSGPTPDRTEPPGWLKRFGI